MDVSFVFAQSYGNSSNINQAEQSSSPTPLLLLAQIAKIDIFNTY
jgi:hypothetical protein